MIKVYIIILNYLTYEDTISLVKSLSNQIKINLKILIIDNCSPNDSYLMLKKEFCNCEYINVAKSERNGGYAYGNNFGLRKIKYEDFEYVIISNNDIKINDNSLIYKLTTFFNKLESPAFLAPIMNINGEKSNHFSWKMPNLTDDLLGSLRLTNFFYKKYRTYPISRNRKFIEVDCVPGSFFISQKKTIYELGLMDENTFLFMEEAILAFKIKALGLKNYIINDIYYEHEMSTTISSNLSQINIRKILINSRLYFHREYLKTNYFGLLLIKLLFRFWIIETFLLNSFKKFKFK